MNNPSSLKIAVVQLNSTLDWSNNLLKIYKFCKKAHSKGVQMLALPEYAFQLGHLTMLDSWLEKEHPAIQAFSNYAKEFDLWLLGGSLAIRIDENNIVNRSYLFKPSGEITGFYDKINLFNAQLNDGKTYSESTFFKKGREIVSLHTPWGNLGLSLCFDIRFPKIYTELVLRGAQFIAIPSAFTVSTGKSHWHILTRARAIETQCFIFAPAQCGIHDDGYQTYGHSLIIDPWGEIIMEAGQSEELLITNISLNRIDEVKKKIFLR